MAGKKTAVFGIYHNANQAERVVDRLREEGFSNDDISVRRSPPGGRFLQ